MQASEFRQRLAGGVNARVHRWLPDSAPPRGIVQIVHGMAEHGARYARLAGALTAAGYGVYVHDLPGHGPDAEPRGHFADRRGWRLAVATVRDVQRLAQKEHGKAPVFVLGHSMGSFLLQHYVADFGGTLCGAIFSATSGDLGPLRAVGLALIRAEAVVFGRRHPSVIGEALSFKAFNRGFKPARTGFEWLSRDEAEVDRYVNDPYCGFRCSTGLWIDLLSAAGRFGAPERLRRIPATLPVLMIAGSEDPVSKGETGPRSLERLYRQAGLRDVTVQVYQGARHELFNDTCRDQVTADLVAWLDGRVASAKS